MWKGISLGAVYSMTFGLGAGLALVAAPFLHSMGKFFDVAKLVKSLNVQHSFLNIFNRLAAFLAKSVFGFVMDLILVASVSFGVLLALFGVVGIINTIQSDVRVPKTFAALNMPKLDFSGDVDNRLSKEIPTCELFAYWPEHCQAQLIPGSGIRKNRTMPGLPYRAQICGEGGELWSMNACRYFAGVGDDWTGMMGGDGGRL